MHAIPATALTQTSLTSDLVIRSDGEIKAETITKFLEQFNSEELPYILKIVSALRFYSSSKVHRMVQELHHLVQELVKIPIERQWFVPVGYVAKSGSAIAFFYKKQNQLPSSQFVMANDLSPEHFRKGSAVIFLDDFIGSGHQIAHFWNKVVKPLLPSNPKCQLILGTLVGYESGIEFAKGSTGFTPVVVDVLSMADRPFSSESTIFIDSSEREAARNIVHKYGSKLYPKYPAGYADSQSLIGFFYSTPNNSLPILWSMEQGWNPLLPRAEVLRDPSDLIGPQPLLSKHDTTLRQSLSEKSSLDAVPYDVASLLLKEFKSLGAAADIGVILGGLNDRFIALPKIIDLIQKLKYAEHEKEAVCTALLLVANDSSLRNALFAKASDDVKIESIEELQSLAQFVDGYSGALVVCSNGSVLGDWLYPDVASNLDYTVPERSRRAAYASREAHGLLFLFSGGGRVSLFHEGSRLLVHRGSMWHRTRIDRDLLDDLTEKHNLEPAVLENVLRLAFNLSDLGAGALITVGDQDEVLRYSDRPNTAHVRWAEMSIKNTPNGAIMPLLKQDGATIISGRGRVIQGMTFLRPPAGVQAVQEVGKGSKHSTAAQISKITKALVIAVSVDGRITLFSNGEHVLKRMG